MSKLSRKWFWRMSGMILLVFAFLFAANAYFLPRYMLYEKKQNLAQLTDEMGKLSVQALREKEAELESRYEATIVATPFVNNPNLLNEAVKSKLYSEGITLYRFWLTEESISSLAEGKQVRKLYNQAKLDTSFLTTFLRVEDTLFVAGDSIAHSEQSLRAVNRFNLYAAISALLLTLGLSWLITRQIVTPIRKLARNAEQIAGLRFQTVSIRTGDEIELLADSISEMSEKLKSAHAELEQKNKNLKTFINDLSHELKTPIALIKAYSSGIEDGLDDGSYIAVIKQKADDMSAIVDRLLYVAKLQSDPYTIDAFDFSRLLDVTLDRYRVAFSLGGKSVKVEDSELHQPIVWGDEQKIAVVLDNFLSNALKYASKPEIVITTFNERERLVFKIRNSVSERQGREANQLWQPFYVGESSRSKELSGSGLGLSIVQAILERHNARYGVREEDGEIEFYFGLRSS